MEEKVNDPNRITYIGSVDYRNKMVKFGIKAKDRTKHTYIIGKSGMGKSTVLENMAIQDIQNGEGLAFLDPHGGTAEKLLDFVPEHRKKDVIYFAPFDTENPVGLNVLEKVDISKRHLVANGLMAAFKKVFGEDKFSDRMQYILNNIILTLLENDDETLIGINRMLSDKEYRKKMVENTKDPSIRSFWLEEFAKAGEKYQQEAAPAIQNKIGQFTSNPLIRNIVGQKRTSFDIREIMDNKKILIMNLSKGKMGEGNANLIGSLLITKIYLAAMSRADVSPYELERLPPFYFYVDEFQSFANDSFADILSEARKYQLALTVAHQYVEQMTDDVKAAIFGNVGTMITFRVGATDAEIFEKEFAPVFTADAIVNLSAYQMYLRLMIDNVGSKPFSAKGLPPINRPNISFSEEILKYSRDTYSKKASEVEDDIKAWYEIKHESKIDQNSDTQNQKEWKNNYSQNKYFNNNVKNENNYTKRNNFNHNNNFSNNKASHNFDKRDNDNSSVINSASVVNNIEDFNNLKNFAKEINNSENSNKNKVADLDNQDKKNNENKVVVLNNEKEFDKPHSRSRHNGRNEKDFKDINIEEVRELEISRKESIKEGNNSLKDAIAKAMTSQKNRIEKIENREDIKSDIVKEKIEEIKELKNKEDTIEIMEEKIINKELKEEALKEIPEKVLRDLVDEE